MGQNLGGRGYPAARPIAHPSATAWLIGASSAISRCMVSSDRGLRAISYGPASIVEAHCQRIDTARAAFATAKAREECSLTKPRNTSGETSEFREPLE